MATYLTEGVDTSDAVAAAEALTDDLSNLDTCETVEDARANISSALTNLAAVATALAECAEELDRRHPGVPSAP